MSMELQRTPLYSCEDIAEKHTGIIGKKLMLKAIIFYS